jgi:hypothetical protein
MKQFDLFANPFPRSRERQPYLARFRAIFCRAAWTQSWWRRWKRRTAANMPTASTRVRAGDRHRAQSVLGGSCGSLAHERDHIIAALDLLFTGF